MSIHQSNTIIADSWEDLCDDTMQEAIIANDEVERLEVACEAVFEDSASDEEACEPCDDDDAWVFYEEPCDPETKATSAYEQRDYLAWKEATKPAPAYNPDLPLPLNWLSTPAKVSEVKVSKVLSVYECEYPTISATKTTILEVESEKPKLGRFNKKNAKVLFSMCSSVVGEKNVAMEAKPKVVETKPVEVKPVEVKVSLAIPKSKTADKKNAAMCSFEMKGKCTRRVCTFAHFVEDLCVDACRYGKNCHRINKGCYYLHNETWEEYAKRIFPSLPIEKVYRNPPPKVTPPPPQPAPAPQPVKVTPPPPQPTPVPQPVKVTPPPPQPIQPHQDWWEDPKPLPQPPKPTPAPQPTKATSPPPQPPKPKPLPQPPCKPLPKIPSKPLPPIPQKTPQPIPLQDNHEVVDMELCEIEAQERMVQEKARAYAQWVMNVQVQQQMELAERVRVYQQQLYHQQLYHQQHPYYYQQHPYYYQRY